MCNEDNIWKNNKIARMEFCSVSRAASLLNCTESDIYHWIDIGVIRKCILIPGSMNAKIEIYSLSEFDLFDTEFQGIISFAYGMGVSDASCFTDIDVEKEETIRGAYLYKTEGFISGVWEAHSLREDDGSVVFSSYDDVIEKNTFFPVELKGMDAMLEAITDSSLMFTKQDYVIVADDLDVLYKNSKTGDRLFRNTVINNSVGIKELSSESGKIHHKKLTAEHNKNLIHNAIAKALVIYPPITGDDIRDYVRNGRIVRARLARLIDQFSHNLFAGKVSPVTDPATLDGYIKDYLEKMGGAEET